MKQEFITWKPSANTLDTIEKANEILAEYAAQGFTMTLRQLHYQFVSRDLYENTPKNYKRLGEVMSQGRLAGLVDWAHMEDRVRSLETLAKWSSPAEIIEAVANQYREDLWEGQTYRPEVWIEKDALVGVIERVCKRYQIDYFACRGYVSQSAQYEAAQRFIRARRRGQRIVVLHLGDHDPSGLDMTRENQAKFELLTGNRIEVRRLALNYDQVEQYDPPANFAKLTDTRAPEYIATYGDKSWELDALDPPVIEGLIDREVDSLLDRTKWARAKEAAERNRNLLEKASTNWGDVASYVRDLG